MLKVYRLNFDDDKFADVRQVRNDVFVVEQGVSESDERDDFESSARHYLITKNDVSCGVARWRNTDKGIKLERFAVLTKYRCSGLTYEAKDILTCSDTDGRFLSKVKL